MLSDYIKTLKNALQNKNEKATKKALKDLERLGVDNATALILASDKCAVYNAPLLKR